MQSRLLPCASGIASVSQTLSTCSAQYPALLLQCRLPTLRPLHWPCQHLCCACRGFPTSQQAKFSVSEPARVSLLLTESFELLVRRLKVAAQLGDTSETEAVLQQMEDAGLPPGPCAYHSLIFSYVRAGQAEAALQAVRREWNAGMATLTSALQSACHMLFEGRVGDPAKHLTDMGLLCCRRTRLPLHCSHGLTKPNVLLQQSQGSTHCCHLCRR